MINRRDFLAAAITAPAAASAASSAVAPDLSGRLARLIFLEDLASLLALSPAVPAQKGRAIAKHKELFLAGAALQPQELPDAAQALAVRAAREAERAYEPLHPGTAPDRLAWDARLIRELAVREGLSASTRPGAPQIADLFDALSRRVLIALHTYIPDDADVEGWMERLILLHESAREYWNSLGAAFGAAAARRDHRFDAAEPWIQAAAALRHGPLEPSVIAKALESEPRSAYARALAAAHSRIASL